MKSMLFFESKKSSSPEPLGQLYLNLAQIILRLRANEGPRIFQRGDNNEKAKIIDEI